MADFEGNLKPIVDFVGVSLKDENRHELLELWKVAECSLNYGSDRNGYSEVYLRVGLKTRDYRPIRAKKKKEEIEAMLFEIAGPAINAYDDLYLQGVHIYPIPEDDDSWRGGTERPVIIDESDESEIWKTALFRLFVSHRSSDKKSLAKVKAKLHGFGIDCFLAHEDIQDTKTWREMIKQGLQSCHAMVTVGTDQFKNSVWCNQEIGWALARGILVLPLLAGESPEGFHSDIQGPTIDLANPDEAALKIAKALCKDPRTRSLVFLGFVQLMDESYSWESLRDVGYQLEKLDKCPADALKKIEDKFMKHPKREGLYSPAIPNWISRQKSKLGIDKSETAESKRSPEDDYDPFADE